MFGSTGFDRATAITPMRRGSCVRDFGSRKSFFRLSRGGRSRDLIASLGRNVRIRGTK
jgi:hypothetical protein